MKQLSCEGPNIGIAVYNEGLFLEKTLRYLKRSFIELSFIKKSDLFICFNGCSDQSILSTLNVIDELKKVFNVHILSSKRGKLRAHQTIINNIKNDLPIIFIDADVFVSADAISKLVREIKEKDKLIVVSAYPYVLYPTKVTFYQRLILPIINLKRIYPQVEISGGDVSSFNPWGKSYFEKQSRIYFHGRCFIIRNKFFYKFPRENSKIRGDDTFLSFIILHSYPPGSIRVLYEAKVFSKPQLSIKAYLKTWYRIRKDLDIIYEEYPQFLKFKKLVTMKPNWAFLNKLVFEDKLRFFLFCFLRKYEAYSYKLLADYIKIDDIWAYCSKDKEK